jgi:hypothetical protein
VEDWLKAGQVYLSSVNGQAAPQADLRHALSTIVNPNVIATSLELLLARKLTCANGRVHADFNEGRGGENEYGFGGRSSRDRAAFVFQEPCQEPCEVDL